MATQGPIGRVLYRAVQLSAVAGAPLFGGVRYYNVPPLSRVQGGLLVASNHQSFFDPVLVGTMLPRRICFLARDTLFEVPVFGTAIWSVGARPVRRGSVSPDAIRTVVKLLRSGEGLLMFPEGTRTRDGDLGRFSPGAASVAIRCGVPVLPVCVEGAFRSWPRTRLLPRPSPMAVAFGEPISSGGQTADELTQRMRGEILRLREFLRERLACATR